MKKRLFDYTEADFKQADRAQIIEAIHLSEGRTMMVENVVAITPPIDMVTNAEVAAAFGADMITLNCLDVFDPQIQVLSEDESESVSIEQVKSLTGRLVGCNLEPIPEGVTHLAPGRTVTEESIKQAVSLGLDYVMLTGNPGNGVSQETILEAIILARSIAPELLIVAGKMHAGGVGNDYNLEIVPKFAHAGADIMMFPAPYTTPGVNASMTKLMMDAVHDAGMLGMLAIGTSQEGASEGYIERVTMDSKASGADIMHIGDGGYSGLAPPENILRMGITLRGRRHQYKRMANRR